MRDKYPVKCVLILRLVAHTSYIIDVPRSTELIRVSGNSDQVSMILSTKNLPPRVVLETGQFSAHYVKCALGLLTQSLDFAFAASCKYHVAPRWRQIVYGPAASYFSHC